MLEDFGAELIINRLEAAGYEAYYVGGCVRNYLLGKPIDDYDVTTSATPQAVCDLFKDLEFFTQGIKHGTVSLVINGAVYEVTTFRTDGLYSDSRHPNNVSFCSTLSEDLSRRDFTVNAIAFNKNKGFIDDFNGIYDIKHSILRCVGDADRRFSEDGLRILRALRFASVYSLEIEEKTKSAILSKAYLLKNISAERINSELTKTILGCNALTVLTEYKQVLFIIIPQLQMVEEVDFYFSWLANCPFKAELRFAVLIYSCKNHFKEICDLLRFSNFSKNLIKKLIDYHGVRLSAKPYLKRLLAIFGDQISEFFDFEEAFALTLNDKDALNEISQARASVCEILQNNECFTLNQLAVDGNDLMSLGYNGAQISKALYLLLDAVINERVSNDKILLLDFLNENNG